MTHPPRHLPHDLADGVPGLRRWRNQPLERERDVHRTRALWRTLLAIVIATAPAGAYLLQQNECLKLSYAISELRVEQRRLAEHERQVTARYAGLESLRTIETWASENGLERPQPDHVVVLQAPVAGVTEAGEIVAVAQPPGLIGPVND
jgi:hypothetical protein